MVRMNSLQKEKHVNDNHTINKCVTSVKKSENDGLQSDQYDSMKVEESLGMIRDFSEKLHLKNQKRIKSGIYALLIIPWVFLIMLLVMKDSKVVYLLLWVISLFLIAAYLIAVAYIDYEMREKLADLGLKMKTEHTALIGNELKDLLKNVEKRHGIED